MKTLNAKRNQNIELLRIIAMLCIIVHHCTINGYGLQERLLNSIGGRYSAFLCIINSFVIIGVNVFFLISGYFAIKPTKRRFVQLVIQLYFYADSLILLSVALGMEAISFGTLKLLLFPFHKYWFVLVYMMLFVLSPILNHGIECLSKQYSILLLGLLTLFFCVIGFINDISSLGLNRGYSLMFAFYLYYIGRLMSRYDLVQHKRYIYIAFWLFSTFVTICGCVLCLIMKKTGAAWRMFSYNQPFIVLSSVSFFCIFLKMQDKKKTGIGYIIQHYARATLPVYYIHTSTVFNSFRNTPLRFIAQNEWNWALQVLILFLYACLIYLFCALIDDVKQRTLSKCETQIVDIIVEKANHLIP